MTELGEYLGNLGRDVEDMKQSLAPHGGTPALFAFSSEQLNVFQTDLIITQTFLSDSNSFIVGHPINGFVGAANGMGGGQIVIGSAGGAGSAVTYCQRRYTWRSQSDLNLGTKTENINTQNGELRLE